MAIKIKFVLYSNMKKVGKFSVDYNSESIQRYVQYAKEYAKENNDLFFDTIVIDKGRIVLMPITDNIIFATSYHFRDGHTAEEIEGYANLFVGNEAINIKDTYTYESKN